MLDLSPEGLAQPQPGSAWTIGRYDEDRGIYTQDLFAGRRTLHVGVDLGGPAGTPVHAFWPGNVRYTGYNAEPGDYGHVLVVQHEVQGRSLYVLLGHLSRSSVVHSPVGRRVVAGEVLGWLGKESENGGWPPHVHVQLAWEDPKTHDMPGAVDPNHRDVALRQYPDPQLILGAHFGWSD